MKLARNLLHKKRGSTFIVWEWWLNEYNKVTKDMQKFLKLRVRKCAKDVAPMCKTLFPYYIHTNKKGKQIKTLIKAIKTLNVVSMIKELKRRSRNCR